MRKLRDYCLNVGHPRGGSKARVLRAALGLTPLDARWLRDQILSGVISAEASPAGVDSHGYRYRVDMVIKRQGREAVIRTGWIIEPGENAPRFVSCWVL
jgi:hypothetical protein